MSRLLLVVFAVLLVVGGLFAISSGEEGGRWAGIILLICAVPLVIGAAWERMRYRSEAADKWATPSGPGGEPPAQPLESRFLSTDEQFVDPTSGRRMRVYLDPASGERRYLAEP